MQVLSKISDRVFMPDWSFRYNCYEVAHTWDPSCTAANVEIGWVVFYEALRMYGSLSVAQLAFQLFLERQKSIHKSKKASSERKAATKSSGHRSNDALEIVELTDEEAAAVLLDEQNNNYVPSKETTPDQESKCNLKKGAKRVHYRFPEVLPDPHDLTNVDQSRSRSLKRTCATDDVEPDDAVTTTAKPTPEMWGPWEKPLVIKLLRSSVQSWLRSSAFLGFNAYVMFSLFCLCRKMTGKFYYRLISVFPATFGCLLAIHIERPSRRNALAVYVANVASEVLFRMGQSRGYYDGLGDPGIALMFSFSVAYLTYRVKSRGFGRDPTSIVLKQLLGKSEAPSVRRESSRRPSIKPVADCASLNNARSIIASRPQLLTAGTDRLQNQLRPDSIANQRSQRFALLRRTWLQLTRWTRFSLKHSTCQHDEPNCALYAAQGFLTPFLVGYIGPALIRSLLNPSRFAAAPLASIWRQLSNGRSVNVALFLGLFSGGFRAGCCSLRWATNSNADWHVFAAAAVAGLASLKAPSSTVATYFLWKAIESGYVDMFKKGFLPNPMYISPLLYAISVNTIFYAGILEPYNVRPSYAKFIERITQNRIHLINRSLLAVFGTNAFIGFEEFWPDLDPRLCSNEFMETVMLWKLGDK